MKKSTQYYDDTAGTGRLDVTGKFLVAMPGMPDRRFAKTVIYLIEQTPRETLGVIVNKPFDGLTFKDLLDHLDVDVKIAKHTTHTVMAGGPVEMGRGFVTHSKDVMLGHSANLGDVAVTASIDMLGMMAEGKGPKQALFTLGYAAWTERQLEDEIRRNDWLVCDASAEILFSTPPEKKWHAAMALAGVPNPDALSDISGRA